MRKADCTPEEWTKYLEYSRVHQKRYYEKNKEKILHKLRAINRSPEDLDRKRAYWRAHYRRPNVIARRKEIDARPESVARRRAYAQTEAAKLRAKHRLEERLVTNPGLRDYRRNYHRLKKTGFTYDLMEQCLKKQNHACAICKQPFSETNKAHADHCHDSNKPRGLLCFNCNIIEGQLRRIGLTPLEWGNRLHEYLTNPPVSN